MGPGKAGKADGRGEHEGHDGNGERSRRMGEVSFPVITVDYSLYSIFQVLDVKIDQ